MLWTRQDYIGIQCTRQVIFVLIRPTVKKSKVKELFETVLNMKKVKKLTKSLKKCFIFAFFANI